MHVDAAVEVYLLYIFNVLFTTLLKQSITDLFTADRAGAAAIG